MNEIIKKDNIKFTDLKLDWKKALYLSAKPLLDDGSIKEGFIENIIENIEKNGPYINLGKGIAIAHTKDSSFVNEDSLSLLRLSCPVIVSNDEENPIYNLFTLATTGSDKHLKYLSSLTKNLSDENILKEFEDATSRSHIHKLLNNLDDEKIKFATVCAEGIVSSFMIKENIGNILSYWGVRDKVEIFIYNIDNYKNANDKDIDEWFVSKDAEDKVDLGDEYTVLDSVIDRVELEKKLKTVAEKYDLLDDKKKAKYVLVIDEGTTSSRAAVFDKSANRMAFKGSDFKQYFPKSGWHEQDPEEILDVTVEAMKEAIKKADINASNIASVGITNQRETTIMWNKKTGKPYYNAIVWACRRGADYCQSLIDQGLNDFINERTGLIIDATYSASKIRWIIDNVEGVKEDIEKDEVLFGTIDTWLLWNLTGGKVHATDSTNASRTMLYNIYDLKWDDEILEKLDIPKSILPEVKDTIDDYGFVDEKILGTKLPIHSLVGDQQSSLFGQACFIEGDCKNTYGTSNVPLVYIGEKTIKSDKGLLTLAWSFDNKPYYAVGASILTTGEVMKWLKEKIKLYDDNDKMTEVVKSLEDSNGVFFVPAFQGLGAPHWDMYARGMIIGLSSGVERKHIIKAGLDSIAYQTEDLLDQIEKETGIKVSNMKVDGGASNNDYLMQFQSNLLDMPIKRPLDTETTSLGVAYLAGLGAGVWENKEVIKDLWKSAKEFTPDRNKEKVKESYEDWKRAVEYSKGWMKK